MSLGIEMVIVFFFSFSVCHSVFSQRQPKKEDVADSTSCQPVKEARSDKRPLGRDVDGVSMETKAVKRARLEMEPLGIEPKVSSCSVT